MKGTSIFDVHAGSWDTAPRMSLAKAVFEAICQRVAIDTSMKVLDFGAGTGLLSVAAGSRTGEVTAMDTSAKMLAVLDDKLRDREIRNIRTCHCDLVNEAHLRGEYDLIISSMTLHHVKDTALLFARFHDVLKTGGEFAVADLDAEDGMFHTDNTGVHHFGFSRDALIAAAADAGFRNLRYEIVHRMEKKRRDGTVGDYRIFLFTGNT